MGNDGGSIPTRRELVKSAARLPTHSEVRSSAASTREYRWSTCPLSKKPLSRPIVSDSAGILYNKDSILEYLLRAAGEAYGDGEEVLQGRVKTLKDVVEVKFEGEGDAGKWVCPISRKELGPGTKAVYLVPCGHAMAESAVREVGAVEKGCLVCSTPYDASHIIPINPTDAADITRLEARIKDLHSQSLTHALKKLSSKKRKSLDSSLSDPKSKKSKDSTATDGIRSSATAAITSKVMSDEKGKHQQRKQQMSDNVKTLFAKKKKDGERGKNTDFMSRGYTLPEGV